MDIKERIIIKASWMFHKEGIKSVRMDDIATNCGISKRTLYENFADREDLIRQTMHYYFKKHETNVMEKLKTVENVIDEFWIIFGHGSEFREANLKTMRDLIRFYPHIFEEFMEEHHSKAEQETKARFEKGIKNGYILENIDVEFMSRLLTSYLYGLKSYLESYDFTSPQTPSPRSFRFAIILFLRGLSTNKGIKHIDEKYLVEM